MGLDNISMMWIQFGFVESSNSLRTKKREKDGGKKSLQNFKQTTKHDMTYKKSLSTSPAMRSERTECLF